MMTPTTSKLITGLAYGSLSGAFTCSMTVVGGAIGQNPDACTVGTGLALFCLAILVLSTAAIVTDAMERQMNRQLLIMNSVTQVINDFCSRHDSDVLAPIRLTSVRTGGKGKKAAA